MSEHSKAPWTWDEDGTTLLSADPNAPYPVVEIDMPEYIAPADKSLIAAAPDLLAACRAALNDRMYREWPAVADLLIAAIAKAEGKA